MIVDPIKAFPSDFAKVLTFDCRNRSIFSMIPLAVESEQLRHPRGR